MTNLKKYNDIKNLCSDFYSEMEKLIAQAFFDFNISNEAYIDDLKSYLLGASKQVRSCLIFLLAQNLGYTYEDKDIIKLATAVEIIHNATLIHDDIIDDAQIRRGNDTIHQKYSNKIGVISGDFLLSIAFNLLISLSDSVLKSFSECLNLLCYGEIQQYFSQRRTSTLSQYLQKSERKTAALFIAALESFAQIKNPKIVTNLKSFALHFGLAFQIRDDIKNILSVQEGKPILSDIKNGIYTAPVIFAFGENEDLSAFNFDDILKKVQETKSVEKTEELLKNEIEMAVNTLSFLDENKYKAAIINLCELFEV